MLKWFKCALNYSDAADLNKFEFCARVNVDERNTEKHRNSIFISNKYFSHNLWGTIMCCLCGCSPLTDSHVPTDVVLLLRADGAQIYSVCWHIRCVAIGWRRSSSHSHITTFACTLKTQQLIQVIVRQEIGEYMHHNDLASVKPTCSCSWSVMRSLSKFLPDFWTRAFFVKRISDDSAA